MLTTYWDHIATGSLYDPQAAGLEFGEIRLPQEGGVYQVRWRAEIAVPNVVSNIIRVSAITDGWRGVAYKVRTQALNWEASAGNALELEMVCGPFFTVPGSFFPYAYFYLEDAIVDTGVYLTWSTYARYLGSIHSMGSLSTPQP